MKTHGVPNGRSYNNSRKHGTLPERDNSTAGRLRRVVADALFMDEPEVKDGFHIAADIAVEGEFYPLVELAMDIEREFKLPKETFGADNESSFDTFGSLLKFVEGKMEGVVS